tara:strand:+ start:165 stop:380 length:216 start_codon:yes stop_codon:yes gene_type:complete
MAGEPSTPKNQQTNNTVPPSIKAKRTAGRLAAQELFPEFGEAAAAAEAAATAEAAAAAEEDDAVAMDINNG